MAVPQQHPPRTQPARLPRNTRAPPRSACCKWCGQALNLAWCSTCVNVQTRSTRLQSGIDTKAGLEATKGAILASLSQLRARRALRERHSLLVERLGDLRSALERRAATVRVKRRQLDSRRDDLRERRCRNEKCTAECAAAWRRLEAKRCRISWDEFLRDPARHSQTIGAFHIYQELSVVRLALQAERKKRCADLVSIFPLKWIVEDAVGDRTVSLAQVASFSAGRAATGVLQGEEVKNMEAALSFLLPLVAALSNYLDVTLPFPCTGARGHEEAQRARALPEGMAAAPQVAWWVQPCVVNPLTERWFYFRIYDGICTKEFVDALRLLDEDLRRICTCQGEVPPADHSTLQLLASSLSAAHLGCVSPPVAAQVAVTAPVSQADACCMAASGNFSDRVDSWRLTSSGTQDHESMLNPKPRRRLSVDMSGSHDDGEWTMVE